MTTFSLRAQSNDKWTVTLSRGRGSFEVRICLDSPERIRVVGDRKAFHQACAAAEIDYRDMLDEVLSFFG